MPACRPASPANSPISTPWSRRPTSCWSPERTTPRHRRCRGDLFRRRGQFPARPHHRRRAQRAGKRLFRTPGHRPRHRPDRRAPNGDWSPTCWQPASPAAGRRGLARGHPEATRIRRAVEEIAASGLTLAKLTVAANLLGDLVKA